ncbi:hypothetical protein BX666DRAFT_419907 [Dichotomocladium elegans]|nr:hypothetical protein BX666DRAFT_419907 [Dichotomocladium elegans]
MVDATKYYESLDVCIRWPDGTDLTIAVSPLRDTVGHLKRRIRQSMPEKTEGKYIQIIYKGRLLQSEEDTKSLSQYGIGKCTGTSLPKLPAPVYIHCSLSDYHPARRPRRENQPEEIQRQRPRLGFDRLLDSGFNEEEIQDIRQQFHRTHGSTLLDDEEPTEQMTAIEEQWMESTGEVLPDGCE